MSAKPAVVLGALIGLYIVTTWAFPEHCRASGLGVALGIGRFGAILGPAIGGLLIGFGWSKAAYFPLFAALLVVGGVSLAGVRIRLAAQGVAGFE